MTALLALLDRLGLVLSNLLADGLIALAELVGPWLFRLFLTEEAS